jgi:tetratricopeptide (TPR) repeat protein
VQMGPSRLAVVLVLSSLAIAQDPSTPQPQQILEKVESRLQADPGNPRLLTIRGAALQALHRDREALNSFSQALAISPKLMVALEGAAQSGYRIHAADTLSYLNRILKQEPTNLTAHAMAGELAFERADCTEANRHFSAAGAEASTSATALQHWGRCLIASGDAHAGSLRLQAASTLAPQDHGILLDYALALFWDTQYDASLAVLDPIPQDSRTLNLKANIYAGQNKFNEAVAAFRQASELAPKDEQNYVDLASLCLEHQSFDVAREVVNAGIANIPDSAALYTLRGAIAAQTADTEQSAADFERARRLQPGDNFGDVGLSLLLRQQDRVGEAIGIIRERLARNPEDPKLNFLLADLLLQSESQTAATKVDAERLLKKSIRLNPKQARAHAALGKLMLANDQAGAAAAELKLALELDPNDRVALNQYILALKRLGKIQEANVAAQRLRDILAEDRVTEVRKNRVRFVLNSNPSR